MRSYKLRASHKAVFDVTGWASFITTSQQYYHLASMLLVIHPVTGAVIDPHFRDAFTHGLNVPRIPGRQAFNPCQNASPREDVTQAIEPLNIDICFADFYHDPKCSH